MGQILSALTPKLRKAGGLCAAMGNFDGVHIGHQKLLEETRRQAKIAGLPSAVITFDPHPLKLLRPDIALTLIKTEKQKQHLILSLAIENLIVLPFTRMLSQLTPQQFVEEVIVDALRVRVLFVGEDFRFGHGRAGGLAELKKFGAPHGLQVRPARPVKVRGRAVSSSWIRELIGAGDMTLARKLLGRPYYLEGTVIGGDHRGRALGFPTANLLIENELYPRYGVYATRVWLRGRPHPAVTNVGLRPTFAGGRAPLIETHIPGFSGNLYGHAMSLEFLKFLRPEQKFSGPEALMKQIAKDTAAALKVRV